MRASDPTENVHIRLMYPEDEPQLEDLMTTAFEHPMSLEFWRWLNREGPWGPARVWVGEDRTSGRLVAHYALLPLGATIRSTQVTVSLCNLVLVERRFQGTPLFRNLGSIALAHEPDYGTRISVGIPNRRAENGHRRVGWQFPFSIPFLTKNEFHSRETDTEEIFHFDESFDRFSGQVARFHEFVISRTAAHLNWRYFQRPNVDYRVFVAKSGDEVDGYVVLKTFHDPVSSVTKAHILDIQAGDETTFDRLVATVENFSVGHDMLTFWMVSTCRYFKWFINRGYEPSEERSSFILFENAPVVSLMSAGSFHFSLGDNDVY